MKQEELTQLIKEVLDEVAGTALARAARSSAFGQKYTLTPAQQRLQRRRQQQQEEKKFWADKRNAPKRERFADDPAGLIKFDKAMELWTAKKDREAYIDLVTSADPAPAPTVPAPTAPAPTPAAPTAPAPTPAAPTAPAPTPAARLRTHPRPTTALEPPGAWAAGPVDDITVSPEEMTALMNTIADTADTPLTKKQQRAAARAAAIAKGRPTSTPKQKRGEKKQTGHYTAAVPGLPSERPAGTGPATTPMAKKKRSRTRAGGVLPRQRTKVHGGFRKESQQLEESIQKTIKIKILKK